MNTIRLQTYRPFLLAQEVRRLDMFDGALPPEPPDTPAPASHDFLVMCLRPEAPLPCTARVSFRSAA